MGDKFQSIAVEISLRNKNVKMWDKGQMVANASRTKEATHTIFVGDKNDTILALKSLLSRKTQWIDYMEEVLFIVII